MSCSFGLRWARFDRAARCRCDLGRDRSENPHVRNLLNTGTNARSYLKNENGRGKDTGDRQCYTRGGVIEPYVLASTLGAAQLKHGLRF